MQQLFCGGPVHLCIVVEYLAGPLGWVGLLIIAATRRSADTLTVKLPCCEAAHLRIQQAARAGQRAGVVLLVAFVAAFLALLPRTTYFRLLAASLAIITLGALVTVIVESVRSSRAMVCVKSRRFASLDHSVRRASRLRGSCPAVPADPPRLVRRSPLLALQALPVSK
jgi:hypothetical protein